MTTKSRLYLALGIILVFIIIAAIFASGLVQFPGTNKQTFGTLQVSITDAPVDLANLNVTVNGLAVNSADNNTWIQLKFSNDGTEVYFDLLALHNVTKDLSITQLPVGNYSKIRLDIKTANATYTDGTTTDLTVPPGHIDVIVSFQIKENQETKLLIDMQADTTAISQSNNLKPILKATVEQ